MTTIICFRLAVNLFLVFEENEVTGESVVVDLSEIPLVETGQFYNVEPDASRSHFIRDDLLEPDGSKVTLSVYRNDLALRSSALKSSSGVSRAPRTPQVYEWDSSTESFYESKASGFPDAYLREHWLKYPKEEKGCTLRYAQGYKGFHNGISKQLEVHASKCFVRLAFVYNTNVSKRIPTRWSRV